jgi:hypothetical protein
VAKASKKPTGNGQNGSRKSGDRPAASRKPATRRGTSPTGVEVLSVDPVTVEALAERSADSLRPQPEAVVTAAADLTALLADVRALRDHFRTAHAEVANLLAVLKTETTAAAEFLAGLKVESVDADRTTVPEEEAALADVVGDALADGESLREHLQASRAEAADLVAALRSEAVEVGAVLRECRQSVEDLLSEIGEHSLALTRARQGREEGAELARGIVETRTEVRALREECAGVGAEIREGRAAFRDALSEALGGVRDLRHEIESARSAVAVPHRPLGSNTAREAHEQVAPAELRTEPEKTRFGATVAPGVVVASVQADGPAELAGIERGDVIEEANGRVLRSGTELRDAVAVQPGEEITVQLRRGGEVLLRTIKFDDPTNDGKSHFGVTVAPGVVVAEVMPGSPAEAAGLAKWDVIEDAHGHPIHSGDQLFSTIHAQPEGAEVMLVVSRNGQRHELLVHLDRT